MYNVLPWGGRSLFMFVLTLVLGGQFLKGVCLERGTLTLHALCAFPAIRQAVSAYANVKIVSKTALAGPPGGQGEKHGQGQVQAVLRCSMATATSNCPTRKMR